MPRAGGSEVTQKKRSDSQVKKLIAISIVLAVLVVLAVGVGTVAATGQPASKATAKMGDIAWLEAEDVWTTILTQNIKMPNQKDLFIDAALQCGIYTETNVKSSNMAKDQAKAVGTISVRVKAVNKATGAETYAFPGADGVVYAMRSQTLWAKLQGQVDVVCGGDPLDCDIIIVAPEEIGLILDTMDAHSFNFVIPDLTTGEYIVVVQAMLEAYTELGGTEMTGEGSAVADASIGYGTVTIEQVRMIKGEELIELAP
jgi:flagellar basal body-associated protein FliL